VLHRRWIYALLVAAVGFVLNSGAQTPDGNSQGKSATPDIQQLERLMATRRDYQIALEQLRVHYINAGDLERASWAEDELRQFHRYARQPYRLEMDVPPVGLKAQDHIAEANELYKRAMTYKDKGWGGTDYLDNQRRAELLFQQILTSYPQSDKIAMVAYQLGDIYESKAYKQYRRAAMYFERCFQWDSKTPFDARLRAARLYDKKIQDRTRAMELYKEVTTRDVDPKRVAEAQKRLVDLGARK
jgi:tetratricopeptide (TPR) repeat protein